MIFNVRQTSVLHQDLYDSLVRQTSYKIKYIFLLLGIEIRAGQNRYIMKNNNKEKYKNLSLSLILHYNVRIFVLFKAGEGRAMLLFGDKCDVRITDKIHPAPS